MKVFVRSLLVSVVFLGVTSLTTAASHPAMTVTPTSVAVAPTQATPVAVAVGVDIKPGSCLNPLSVKAQGRLPVAVLGSEAFDVRTVDICSVRLQGVVPVHASFEDVTTPIADGCTTEGPDGYLDLTLKFMVPDIVQTLGAVEDGDVISLFLSGMLLDEYGGSSIEGSDCVIIRANGNGEE